MLIDSRKPIHRQEISMTDENQSQGADTQAPAQSRFHILAQYVRDLSFENILAQKGIQTEAQPDIQVQVNLDARKRAVEHRYEIIMLLKIESSIRADATPLFLLEIDYGGVFHVENIPKDQLHPFLLIECPRMLFPFVRRIVHDITRDGGFPPLNLDNIDFVQLYRAELTKRAQEEKIGQPVS